MSVAIPPLPYYAFMAWCLVKAQGQPTSLVLYSHLYLCLPSGLFSSGSLTIFYAFLISFMPVTCQDHLILLHLVALIRSTNYETLHYVVFSRLLLLLPP
jgi:hypothetical protein